MTAADRRALSALAAALPAVRVAGTGDVMLDRFVEGGVGRISPEAPIPVLRVEAERAMPGGAGNVLANLAALGARTRFVSVVGDDAAGAELTGLLEAVAGSGLETVVAPGRTTPVKTRFVAAGQQLLRADRESPAPLGRATAERVTAAALTALAEADVLFLSDYAKGTLTPDLVRDLIAAAERQGKPVLVDPKGRDLSRYRGAMLLKPNRAELALATGLPVATVDDARAAGRELMARCDCANLLVTLGADGMLLLEQGGGAHHFPGLRREVFDVGGAGDTVLATLAAAVAAGLRRDRAPGPGRILHAAAELANVAGAVAVGRRGTATVGAADLQRALVERELLDHEAKVLDRRGARELVEAARARRPGVRIGFTNGCFDILHPGHVALLARARAACDLLVVGVNGDDSVRRLKGAGRPVNPEQARCLVLASLAGVDAVVVFEEDTPLGLIEELRPDLLVKGADYAPDQVVGADLVRAWGGEVMLAEIVPGFSTTGTIGRLGGSDWDRAE